MTAVPVAETMLDNFSIPVMLPEEDGSWKNLTLCLRRAVMELDDEKMRAARGPSWLEFAVKSQRQMTRLPTRCVFSSWCRFPAYGMDFGWGKPAWVAFGGSIIKHSVVIVDRKGGDGVEAWVSLEQDEMGHLVHQTLPPTGDSPGKKPAAVVYDRKGRIRKSPLALGFWREGKAGFCG
ncbi:Deacetylvindoline O-acetyltransferase [Platanthera guangdongensis]|uniref:Deacetylvindoline O-acetyltransferase n=1 Tax=Platanthera guangdongensis TaxID=2320717 RepID=A0ABR2M8G6_9ASPA